MRKWCATVALGALFALPLCAQQKDASTADTTKDAADTVSSGNAVDSDFHIAPSTNLFAMPSMPAPNPDIYTDWANNPWNRHAWGRLTPRYEIAGMYQYVNYAPGGGYLNFNNHGASGSFTYNATNWLGLTAEIAGYHFNRQIYGAPVLQSDGSYTYTLESISGSWQTYLFGPRVNIRKFDHFVPFFEFMAGVAHSGSQLNGNGPSSVFALAAGGGIDVILTKYVAWRFFQADYLMTDFNGVLVTPYGRENNFRIGTGVVLRWGYPPEPPKPIHPPTAACSANPTSVYEASNEPIAIHVDATDPDKVGLTYSYSASGGTVEGTGPDARFNTSGLAVGSYTVTAKVDNGHGGNASCTVDVAINKRPIRPPTVSCAPERNPIIAGERVAIRTTATDPQNLPLTYSYSASGGQISGNGPSADFDSTGLSAGSYTVTCTADDGQQNGRASATTNVDVQQPAPPPQASKVGECGYTKVGAGRFDNACKRVGDDVALRLKNEPNSRLVIVGYADPKEPRPEKLAQTRADGAKKYLGEKGIDASRITTRVGTASTEKGAAAENRRVDFIFVPEGASY
jgi:hypothetical protein